MLNNKKSFALKSAIAAILAASTFCSYAANVEQIEDAIAFNTLEHSQYKLTLVTPHKQTYTFEINSKEFSLMPDMLGLKAFDDGSYKFELSPIVKAGALGSDVRALGDAQLTQEFKNEFNKNIKIESGTFTVVDNTLVENIQEETALKDFVINDDLIVDGSACIGFDCVNGESFGFDTIRLKENNLRIKFDDTSSGASFPNVDWQLTANDSANGGANKFSIDDVTNSRTIFTVEARAPSNSLYVDDGGRIGLGTSTPSTDIHVISGDSPTLRLQQDGSSGFAPQSWDIAGNETNFFVRDVTNGSALPLRIRPGAPTNSIFVDVDGDVGYGTASPDANLHILESTAITQSHLLVQNTNGTVGARTMAQLENNGPAFFDMTNSNTSQTWRMRIDGTDGFGISKTGDADDEFFLTDSGNLTISGTLTTAGMTCGGGCDLVFTKDYQLPTIEEHANNMWRNSYLPNVGPTVENKPINLSDKTGRILNELETAHIYIEQLNNKIKNKNNELSQLKFQFTDLEKRLAKLEQN